MKRASLWAFVTACTSAVPKPTSEPVLFNAHADAPPAPSAIFVHNLLERRLGSQLSVNASPDGMIGFDVRARTQLGEARRKTPDVRIDAAANVVSLPAYVRSPVVRFEASAGSRIDANAGATNTIRYCIDELGTVSWVDAGGLAPSVAGLVRTWRFAPYFLDGKPVRACSEIAVVIRGDIASVK